MFTKYKVYRGRFSRPSRSAGRFLATIRKIPGRPGPPVAAAPNQFLRKCRMEDPPGQGDFGKNHASAGKLSSGSAPAGEKLSRDTLFLATGERNRPFTP